ncbi:uncharacterized protein LOC129051034 [Pongo abelii]|uniref:uncharacterized protein LOC129051034 n=1 Tax=Pongo abelii TaxID=9601 RepID=UPI0023E78DE2|nr:uncharacterized protein LOC129051034 [Pongo abelii]
MSAAVFFPPSSPLPIVFFPSLLFSVFYPPPYPHLLLAAASSCHAFFSPHQIFSLPLPTVLSPRRLLPAACPQPFSSPHTVFFPCPPTVWQERLSVAIFFPLSSLPLPIVFFPSLLFPPSSSPPPPFSSRFHLPTFSQQRLPAALFSPPLPSPLFHSPPSSPPIVFLPTPFSRSPTAFHLEAPHACPRLCPCPRKVVGTSRDLQGRRPWDKGGRVWS